MKKIFAKIFSALLTVIIVLSIGTTIATVITKKNNHGVANFFGTQFMVVRTDSMEPVYPVSTLVIIKKVDPATIKLGDDIAFIKRINAGNNRVQERIVTHRVYEEPSFEGGKYYFVTKGINENSSQCQDHVCLPDAKFSEDALMGKVVSQNKFIGKIIYSLFFTSIGLACVIFIPLSLIVIYAGVGVYKAFKDKNDKEGADANEKK